MATCLRLKGQNYAYVRPAHDKCSLFDAQGFSENFPTDPEGSRIWAPVWMMDELQFQGITEIYCVVCGNPVVGKS
jgi:hypothetical protein